MTLERNLTRGEFNLVIRNGLVFDTRGGDEVRADVAIAEGLIPEVGYYQSKMQGISLNG